MPTGHSGARAIAGDSPVAKSIQSIIKQMQGDRLQSSTDILVTRSASGTTLKIKSAAKQKAGKKTGSTTTEAVGRPFEVVPITGTSLKVVTFSRLSGPPGTSLSISGLGDTFTTTEEGDMVYLEVSLTVGTLAVTGVTLHVGGAWATYPDPIGVDTSTSSQNKLYVPIAELAALSDARPGVQMGTRKIIQLVDSHLCLFVQAHAGRARMFALPFGATS